MIGIPLGLLTIYGLLAGFGVITQPRHQVGNLFGYANILTNLLYSSPFERPLLVLRHRSAVVLNIHMVCAGAFNNSIWVTYTALTHQWIIFSVNAFCATMGWIQIILYLVFHPNTHPFDDGTPTSDPKTTFRERTESLQFELIESPTTRSNAPYLE